MRLANKAIALGATALAGTIFAISWALGKAGHCRPHQVDGQCGLSTFAGLLEGGAAAIVIALLTSILTGVRIWKADHKGRDKHDDLTP